MAVEEEPESNLFWQRVRYTLRRDAFDGPPAVAPPGNRGLVIAFCVLVSFVLWFAFSMQRTFSLGLELETRVGNVPSGESLTVLAPRTVQYEVVGQGLSLLQLYYNRPAVPVDGSADRVDFAAAAPEWPKGIRVESVRPQFYYPNREARVVRRIPVVLRGRVTPSSGWDFVEPPSVTPDSIEIAGARSLVESVRYWPTRPVNFEGVRDSLAVVVPLVDSLRDLINRPSESVELRAFAHEFTQASRDLEVRVVGAPLGEDGRPMVTLEPRRIRVTFRVRVAEFDAAMQTTALNAVVPYESIRRDTSGLVIPQVNIPDDLVIQNLRWQPAALRYFDFFGGG